MKIMDKEVKDMKLDSTPTFSAILSMTNMATYALGLCDPSFMARGDLIANTEKPEFKRLFWDKHKIHDEAEYGKWVSEAAKDVFTITREIKASLKKMTTLELTKLAKGTEGMDAFLLKWKKKEDELKNDKFLQCD